MCTSIILPSGLLCDTVGELRKGIYPKTIIPHADFRLPLDQNTCLCTVDLPALAAREGWSLASDDHDPMRYIASPSLMP